MQIYTARVKKNQNRFAAYFMGNWPEIPWQFPPRVCVSKDPHVDSLINSYNSSAEAQTE